MIPMMKMHKNKESTRSFLDKVIYKASDQTIQNKVSKCNDQTDRLI